MGWTSFHKEPGVTMRQVIQEEIAGQHYEVVATISHLGVTYAALRTKETGAVWALVMLTKHTRDHFNFTYKTMDESMGPVEAECPTRILDLLTPTDSEWANQWRERCRQNAAKPKLVPGMTVKFARPLSFSCFTEDTFTVERWGKRRLLFLSKSEGILCSISGWKQREYEVVS